MSICFDCDIGCYISSDKFINSFLPDNNCVRINEKLFQIWSPYFLRNCVITHLKKSKQKRMKDTDTSKRKLDDFCNFKKEVLSIQEKYSQLLSEIQNQGYLRKAVMKSLPANKIALETAEFVYNESGKNTIKDALGSNCGPVTIKTIQNARYIFPKDCTFFCKDVQEMEMHLSNKKFDLILLDPPWWNKYIRRKRKKCSNAYDMMYNCDLMKIPIEMLLEDNGVVVVWCTNSLQHLKSLINDIFPKWGVHYGGKWFWLKVTMFGEPICEFSEPPGKQPFEQIIFGFKDVTSRTLPTYGKLLVSIPSAIHSHKPPLIEVLRPFLPDNPKCLEVFARYLLPDWTSYGNEVLRFQHESLYTFKQ